MKNKIKRILQSDNRPNANEFGVSRYMLRDDKIYMLDNGIVYHLQNPFWKNPDKELHSLRTKEMMQRIKRKRNESIQ